MKINRLFVSEYKNLSNIDISFNSNISLLVGQNGLGKSNLMEILATIFSELYLSETEEDILDFLKKGEGFGYEINYNLHNYCLNIKLDEKEHSLSIQLIDPLKDLTTNIDFPRFKKEKGMFLPTRIVGYYSGENKRILSILAPHMNKVKEVQRKRTKLDSKLRPIFFTENYHSQLIMLTIAVYKDKFLQKEETGKKLADNLFEDYLKIRNIKSFDIRFNNPDNNAYKKAGIDSLGGGFTRDEKDTFWGLKSYPNELMNLLISIFPNKFLAYENEKDELGKKEDDRSYVKEIVKFTNITLDEIKEHIWTKFPHPLEFFDALESSHVLGVLGEIRLYVDKIGVDQLLTFDQLSEGEQQLVSVIGMLLLTWGEQNLFLLDEPDTHINPNWQREYVKLVKDVLPPIEQSHVFISTHSPLLVQSYNSEDLILFRKDRSKVLLDTNDYQISNWRLDHVLMSPYFDLPSARPPQYDTFMKLRDKVIAGKQLDHEEQRELSEFENVSGHYPTGETFAEIETQKILRSIAKKIK